MQHDIQSADNISSFIITRLINDLDSIHSEVNGVIESIDIEYIHRIRIAIRRYRNNLKIFRYFADQSFYDFLTLKFEETTEFSTLLAYARDLDILDFLIDQGLELPQTIEKSEFLETIRAQRNDIQNQLLAYFNTSSYTLLLHHTDELKTIHLMNTTSSIEQSKIFDAICSSFAFALSVLYPLSEKTDGEEVHRFRKAIRRVRYTLETFQPVIAKPIDNIIEESHLIQDLLGDLHDLDMLALTFQGAKPIQSKIFLEIINKQQQQFHLQFVEKLKSKEMVNFLFNQIEYFSKDQTTIWM